MNYPEGRPKAHQKPRSAPSAPASNEPARPPGRPRKGADGSRVRDLPGVTVRVEPDVLARIDAEVDRRNDALRPQGASTNRGAVMALLLREAIERAEAAAGVTREQASP